ncbi:hypothetical protein [Streptomyces sp. SP17KL33]|uniref:hypothetical protein n=1 Tax=Streptomyces sp. SP17KL33 TaxID=3002534 RepID=UPI002E770EC2|nr:hypothetical protein [Streptomyces sp. SP17KL33]MEE1831730.1 hypothetical protein [Streptomyces sp. SP17KL33]
MVDVSVAVAGATGGLSSGLVVSASGYPVLALTGGILALAVRPAIATSASSRCPGLPVGGSRAPSPWTAPGAVVHVFARTSSARC